MMRRVDAFFLGGMVLIALGAVFFAVLKSGAFVGKPRDQHASVKVDEKMKIDSCMVDFSSGAVLVGNQNADLCTCYEQAFQCGATRKYTLSSASYQTGYSACTKVAGESGGNAWSYGWSKGNENKPSQRSCRFYMNELGR